MYVMACKAMQACSIKRDLYSVKRDLYSVKRGLISASWAHVCYGLHAMQACRFVYRNTHRNTHRNTLRNTHGACYASM